MSVVPLTEAQLRAQVKTVCDKVPDARVIGVHAPGPWTGPASVHVDGEEVEVAFCPSTLALRERLASRAQDGPRLVVVTDREEAELGGDVLARLARRRLYRIDCWRVVMDIFHARELDPRLRRERWLAEALLEEIPADGYPPVPSGVLDEETVWDTLLCARLGLCDSQPDARALLRWTLATDRMAALVTAPTDLQNAMVERLAAASGPVGIPILRCILAGRGHDALPVGLVCRVLFAPGTAEESRPREAAVRLEPILGGHALETSGALGWADGAEAVVREIAAGGGSKAAAPWLERADVLLREVRAEDFAYQSPVLISGFEQRLARCAAVLSRFLAGASLGDLEALRTSVEAVVAHDHAVTRPDRVEILRMACRLARRLRQPATDPGSFADAALQYASDGSFADWARVRVWDGDALPAVSEVYRTLSARLAEARQHENRRFGELLAEWLTLGSSSDPVVPVEDVLARVAVPLAQHVRVLLVVIDAMSLSVFHELVTDLTRHGWIELGEGVPPLRRPSIAALPSVTEVSRASLFCGALRRGTSQVERDGFASHPGLVAASRVGSPPVLFHKADLVEAGGVGLAEDVRAEIARPTRQVVGVVVNAVDDHLAKGDQLGLRWTVDAIRPLQWLLDAAREAGRVIVLTSDHGHVLDRDSVYRPREIGGLRCRPDDGTLEGDELRLRGPRVLSPWGDRVIVPWTERVRYGVKQNGYHGGATPQEVVIPLAVLSAGDTNIPGWAEIAPVVPEWWEIAESTVTPEPTEVRVPVPPAVTRPSVARPTPQGELFKKSAVPLVPAPAPPSWVDRLLASATYAAQKQLAARPGLDDERVRRCLVALDERGGKMTRAAMARALAVPPLRLAGMFAALRRLLNVEGYAVLSVDEASDTVELNRHLLETQFDL
jgi:hypothetical protein